MVQMPDDYWLSVGLDGFAAMPLEHLFDLLGGHAKSGPQAVDVGRRLTCIDRPANRVEHGQQIPQQIDLAVAKRVFVLPPRPFAEILEFRLRPEHPILRVPQLLGERVAPGQATRRLLVAFGSDRLLLGRGNGVPIVAWIHDWLSFFDFGFSSRGFSAASFGWK